ncbi:hypothetical protein FH972_012791 [Carpinus fangiana]|uniref:Uncharacterized protein n=1 Tax=Carpinus fangiana TaxID=176857 RepID=A0A5N6R834_9ROSI|nr:hypothetical protein FH972_012791 [Carpinus fangiana]
MIINHFSDLLSSTSDDDSVLSIAWLRKLLDTFLCYEAEFKALLLMGCDPSQISKPPLDCLVPELLNRVVKVLDVYNAATHRVESIRHYQKLAVMVVVAFEQKPIGDGQVRRTEADQ